MRESGRKRGGSKDRRTEREIDRGRRSERQTESERDRQREKKRKKVCQNCWYRNLSSVLVFISSTAGCEYRQREREIERIRERKKNKTTQFNLKLYRKL